MRRIHIVSASLILMMASVGTADAQFMKRLGNAAKNAAERTIERKAVQKTEEAVEKTVDKISNPETYKGENNEQRQTQSPPDNVNSANAAQTQGTSTVDTKLPTEQQQQQQQQVGNALEISYAKSDFVAGDEMMFEDLLIDEQLGEFPSMWDLLGGNAEIAKVNGENVINLLQWSKIVPLMKEMKNYLSESFTVEFDFYVPAEDRGSRFFFSLLNGNAEAVTQIEWVLRTGEGSNSDGSAYLAKWMTTGNEARSNSEKVIFDAAGWHKFALSFNKRALKVYMNGRRVTNVPNVAQAGSLILEHYYGEQEVYVKNIRIAKGAVPLYERMMSEGKFISYGISFDVGKSLIKPESMGEINRVVQLMTENPNLKFSVEGHTDNTGNAASNQTLSEARSKAIVDKLVSLGISADRLSSSGKGQNSPIADNATDEGRAKNRRVEFVKL